VKSSHVPKICGAEAGVIDCLSVARVVEIANFRGERARPKTRASSILPFLLPVLAVSVLPR